MSRELTFRKAREADLPRISEFRKTLFEYNPTTRSHELEYYDWKCYQNPVRQGEIWVAEDGETLVGMRSMTPKKIRILATEVDGAETGDTFTHPQYQRQGIFTRLFKAAKEPDLDSGLNFIYGVPNQISQLGYERRLDYARVPIKLRNLIKSVKSKRLLNTRLHYSPLVAISAPVVDTVSQTLFRIGTRGTAGSDVIVYAESAFPDDINTLWEQTSKNYDVMLVRTRDYLNWRYVTNPDTYSILVARNSDGAIKGYMVAKIGFSNNIAIGFLVDFLTLEDNANIFKKLLIASWQSFYQKNVSAISVWAVKGSFYDKILLKLGFLPHNAVTLICYKNELGRQVVSGHYKWHFTMGDSDNI